MRLEFDRGTVLLRDLIPRVEPSNLPGVRWDARVRAHRAPAWRYGAVCRALAAMGVPVRDDVRLPVRRPDGWAAVDLRAYQRAALAAWEAAGRRGLVVLPTGSGKTRLALAAMAAAGARVLCLVPTRVLLHQWVDELRQVYRGEVGRYGDGERTEAPVTVATIESAWRHMDRLGDRFELLVVDEAHHFGCGLRDEALEMSIAAHRLGLTATPPRDPTSLARLGELLGPVVYELAIADLAGTFLSSFDLITLQVELDRAERLAYQQAAAAFQPVYAAYRRAAPPMAAWPDFTRAAARSPEGRAALVGWRRLREIVTRARAKSELLTTLLRAHPDGRVLIFCGDNESAYAVAREQLVMPITCDIGRAERDHALERFRRGELRALVSARVLNEGLDVPDADVAIIVGAAHGEREHVQRVGRVLRPGPGKRATVYELVCRETVEVRQAARRRQGLVARSAAQL